MNYDLVIKNGMVVDGSGAPRYQADVGVKDGKIARIGRINGDTAQETLDAEGHVVTPGFVDGHTHMDAQVFWDPLGSCSCYHGVTTAVMGNCGFTLAPCRESEADLVFRNLERAEDISRTAMLAGINWDWETYPEYMDAVDRVPKGINYAGYIGHSALRTYVMGERAFSEEPTDADMTAMKNAVREAVGAGAIGFSTSRSPSHMTSDNRFVASRTAPDEEVEAIVKAMGETGAGIFQLAMERGELQKMMGVYRNLAALSKESGRPVTFGSLSRKKYPGQWKALYEIIEEENLAGARLFTQVHSREINTILSFETATPFDHWEVWQDFRRLPLNEQKVLLRTDSELRRRLIDVASRPYEGPEVVGAEPRPPEWDMFYVMDRIKRPHRTVAEVATERGVPPAEAMIDLALEHDFKLFFRQPIANENQDDALALMKHPRSMVTFSDSGAHVSQIMDSSLQTHLLSHWVREKEAFTLEEAVRLITYDTATNWGFHDRGLLREGLTADIAVFDPATVEPRMPEVAHDLPGGSARLKQYADGFLATVVAGEIVLKENQHTGALPGKLLRGPLARR
ncbi:MAG: N-acyl-D-amino-acid deacylase [Myxococcota bacterium]|jgi:N-acyl-D-amino-acid deacylase